MVKIEWGIVVNPTLKDAKYQINGHDIPEFSECKKAIRKVSISLKRLSKVFKKTSIVAKNLSFEFSKLSMHNNNPRKCTYKSYKNYRKVLRGK